jgi:hypothetical protein
MTFVLDTVCDPETRQDLLARSAARLAKGGVLALEARGVKDLRVHRYAYLPCSDGYFSRTSRTFVRGFTSEHIDAMLVAAALPERTWLSRSTNGYSLRVLAHRV